MRTATGIVAAGLSVLAIAVVQAETVEVKTVQNDQYVTRIMKFIRKAGEPIPGLAKIDSYSPDSKAFIVRDVTGGSTRIPVSDIKRIEFEQQVIRQSPAAQSSLTIITAKAGREAVEIVPEAQLKIDSGTLTLEIPGTAHSSGKVDPNGQVAELKSIEYDNSRKAFVVKLQYFSYSMEHRGGGGGATSGGGKGLH